VKATPPAAARPPRAPRIPADPVRVVALDALRTVREKDAYANLVLPGLLASRRLEARDAAFATELVYGTLRALGTYDAILGDLVDRPLDALDPLVLDVLRLGTHQLLATRIGDHAAVDESVKLVRDKVGHGPTGLVNAVLRKVAARDLAGWCTAISPRFDIDPIGHLSLTHSHPRWIVEGFRNALHGDLDETTALLAADNLRPAVTLVARPGRCDVEELVSFGARPGRWAPTAAILDGGAPTALAAVREGRAGVQDEGSQLVALALAAAPIEGNDRRWLDMCAGPGGKAALLAGLAAERGARLLAVERQPHRARLVSHAVADTADVAVADGIAPPWAPASFDRVLVDVPCSGLGALRRRPEARWRRTLADVEALRPQQIALLNSALDAVRPGGLVAYVTCSPHLRETRSVVDEALDTRSGAAVERIDVRPYLPDVEQLGEGPDVQLWPHRHGTDAMYISLLRRGSA
jgi:16S rRNA (cytosine967-C5)-methyltransferase